MTERNTRVDWDAEDSYWRTSYSGRPYVTGSREYDYYRPGYRYGYEAAHRYADRSWNDVEPELSRSWSSYEHRGTSTWEQIKDAVRDAWDRVTGNRPVSSR
jgi:hypothetical protein